ncbi:MAG: 4Fe-4S binding protein [Thermoleophilia bacterium]|jgi:pyruvate ferredoxin oxidoreductase delta subunit|nr:4Fe-4S binding protein [Thermoleophilia bacterium]
MSAEKKAAAAKPAPARKKAAPSAKAAPRKKAAPAAKAAPARQKPGAAHAARGAGSRKPQWDVSDLDTWGPDRHELGATIPEAGNSIDNETGGWRTFVPEIDSSKCDGCMLCYFYCPDASIKIEGGKAVGVDLEHCKGCGICAKECPRDAITMKLDEKE